MSHCMVQKLNVFYFDSGFLVDWCIAPKECPFYDICIYNYYVYYVYYMYLL